MNVNIHNITELEVVHHDSLGTNRDFSVLKINDIQGNRIDLFFGNPSEVLEFALSIEKKVSELGTLYTRENLVTN